MLGRLAARVIAILWALSLTLHASASDAIGVLHPLCGFPYQYVLEITAYRGHKLERKLQFKVLGLPALAAYGNQWVDSPRQDDANFGRIQIVRVSRHWWRALEMSGNFEIEFTDGRHMEGSFKARYLKPPTPVICE